MQLDALQSAIAAAFAGDADDFAELLAEDVTWRDQAGAETLSGRDATLEHFAAFGGRRERLVWQSAVAEADRVALEFVLALRADAIAFAQHSTAFVELDGAGRIREWRGLWVEEETDLRWWGGD